MTTNEIIDYWINSSDDDFATMEHLFKNKDYSWSLFMGHLVIEKLLKANYVKKIDINVPHSHNLVLIAEKSNLSLNEEQRDFLDMITTFNIKARYDDYKLIFRKTCTKDFTSKNVNQIKEFRLWLKKTLLK